MLDAFHIQAGQDDGGPAHGRLHGKAPDMPARACSGNGRPSPKAMAPGNLVAFGGKASSPKPAPPPAPRRALLHAPNATWPLSCASMPNDTVTPAPVLDAGAAA